MVGGGEGDIMRLEFAKTAAILAAALSVAAAGVASPAMASTAAVAVPCSAPALAAVLAGAISGETLLLARSCRYVLTAALPAISQNLTIEGDAATLERSHAAGTPDFAILTVTSGDLAVSHLSFSNGDGGAITYDSNSATTSDGSITVTGGTFTGNTAGAINNSDPLPGPITVTRAAFTGNAGGVINDGGPLNGLVGDVAIAGSTFIRNGGGISYENYGGPQPGPSNSGFAVTRSAFNGNTGGAINCPIFSFWCDFTISHSSFTANSDSAIDVGGFSSEPLSANPDGVVISVTNTTFTRNSSSQGGAINLDGEDGDVIAIRDTFAGNTATQGGGGIYVDFPGDTTVKGSLFTGNSAPVGGAINNSGTTEITGSAFRGNTASTDGGALYNDTSATVTGTTFTHNTAYSDGGAIYQSYNQTLPSTHLPNLSLTRSRIRGNYAGQHGGGLDDAVLPTLPDLTATAALTSSQIIANLAGQDGGGIYNQGGAVPLTSSLIMNNHPDNCAPVGSVPGCTD